VQSIRGRNCVSIILPNQSDSDENVFWRERGIIAKTTGYGGFGVLLGKRVLIEGSVMNDTLRTRDGSPAENDIRAEAS